MLVSFSQTDVELHVASPFLRTVDFARCLCMFRIPLGKAMRLESLSCLPDGSRVLEGLGGFLGFSGLSVVPG